MFAALLLMLKSLAFLGSALVSGLPGWRFDLHGRRLGLRMLVRVGRVHPLLVTPVSSVRYFEFDFARRCLPAMAGELHVLEVSSPFLFGLYRIAKQSLRYRYVNPDIREKTPIAEARRYTVLRGMHSVECADARALPYSNDAFDYVVTISVVEHIDGEGDSQALREMWRVLMPVGRLVFTVPVKPCFEEEEYRDENVYGLPVQCRDGRWFVQRYYDGVAIAARLRAVFGPHQVIAEEVWGETHAGFFAGYEQRWLRRGWRETVKDPQLMATHMTRYTALPDIAGMAVYGACLRKEPV